jgi:hypothetical protein
LEDPIQVDKEELYKRMKGEVKRVMVGGSRQVELREEEATIFTNGRSLRGKYVVDSKTDGGMARLMMSRG